MWFDVEKKIVRENSNRNFHFFLSCFHCQDLIINSIFFCSHLHNRIYHLMFNHWKPQKFSFPLTIFPSFILFKHSVMLRVLSLTYFLLSKTSYWKLHEVYITITDRGLHFLFMSQFEGILSYSKVFYQFQLLVLQGFLLFHFLIIALLAFFHIFKDSKDSFDVIIVPSYYCNFFQNFLSGRYSRKAFLQPISITIVLYSLMFFLKNFIDLFNSSSGSSPLILLKS